METAGAYWGYTAIMENKMETTVVYRGYMGIMENKLDTTIVHIYIVQARGACKAACSSTRNGHSSPTS